MKSVYIETTVVSYLVSRPSRDLVVAGHQQLTREWWDRRRTKFTCLISQVVLDEAQDGDAEQAALRLRTLDGISRLAATAEAERLAECSWKGFCPLKPRETWRTWPLPRSAM